MSLEYDGGMCFACGQANPIGLKLRFAEEAGKFTARFTPLSEHQGYDSITHGGIVCTLLDEAMAKLVYENGDFAVTAEMSVRFRKPAKTGEELLVTGWVVSRARRIINCAAEIHNPAGELVAEATGRMFKV